MPEHDDVGIGILLGKQGQAIEGLKESFDQHCKDDDRRHVENLAEIKGLRKAIEANTAAMRKIAGKVTVMQPTVDFFKDNKPKILVTLGVASFVLTGMGAIVWAVVSKYVAALIAAAIAAMTSGHPPR